MIYTELLQSSVYHYQFGDEKSSKIYLRLSLLVPFTLLSAPGGQCYQLLKLFYGQKGAKVYKFEGGISNK